MDARKIVTPERWDRRIMTAILIVSLLIFCLPLAGCMASKPVIETVTIEKPVPVPCRIPPIDKPAFAVDQVSQADDMATINRALRAELEQRRGYEKLLEAGVKACQ